MFGKTISLMVTEIIHKVHTIFNKGYSTTCIKNVVHKMYIFARLQWYLRNS